MKFLSFISFHVEENLMAYNYQNENKYQEFYDNNLRKGEKVDFYSYLATMHVKTNNGYREYLICDGVTFVNIISTWKLLIKMIERKIVFPNKIELWMETSNCELLMRAESYYNDPNIIYELP